MSMEGRLSAMSEHINLLLERVDALEKDVRQLKSSPGKSGTEARQSSSTSSGTSVAKKST